MPGGMDCRRPVSRRMHTSLLVSSYSDAAKCPAIEFLHSQPILGRQIERCQMIAAYIRAKMARLYEYRAKMARLCMSGWKA
jgi:hypothetical protein